MNTKSQNKSETTHEHEELARLVKLAQEGDLAVLPQLRATLDGNPALWSNYGDLAAHAELSLVRLAAGRNLLLGESVQRKLEQMKKELGGETPTPLERLLVARIAATWLQLAYFDALVVQRTSPTEAEARALQRQVDAAHRRHLSSVKALVTVRKLLIPALSPVDVAGKLDRSGSRVRGRREGIAGTVPAAN